MGGSSCDSTKCSSKPIISGIGSLLSKTANKLNLCSKIFRLTFLKANLTFSSSKMCATVEQLLKYYEQLLVYEYSHGVRIYIKS